MLCWSVSKVAAIHMLITHFTKHLYLYTCAMHFRNNACIDAHMDMFSIAVCRTYQFVYSVRVLICLGGPGPATATYYHQMCRIIICVWNAVWGVVFLAFVWTTGALGRFLQFERQR